MKRLLSILLVLLFCFTLTACSGDVPVTQTYDTEFEETQEETDNFVTENTKTENEPFEMELVGRSSDNAFEYYRDTTTDVLYTWNSETKYSSGAGVGGGLTEMHDPETGLPLTYTRYMELHSKK